MLLDRDGFTRRFLDGRQAILVYLTKTQKDVQFVHDKRARTLSTGYWPLHQYEYERIFVYKRAEHLGGLSQVWVGERDGIVLDENGVDWHYLLKNVEGPFDTPETFMALFRTQPSQTIGYLYPKSKQRSKRVVTYRKATIEADDILKVPPEEVTTAKRLREVRLCQQRFRNTLFLRWDSKCAVTGITEPLLLRASHIKPFAHSSDAERVSAHNGLLLSAGLDALFDRGFIRFDASGKLICSRKLNEQTAKAFGIRKGMRLSGSLTEEAHTFIDYHRKHVFEKKVR
jgi:hypothetical protein